MLKSIFPVVFIALLMFVCQAHGFDIPTYLGFLKENQSQNDGWWIVMKEMSYSLEDNVVGDGNDLVGKYVKFENGYVKETWFWYERNPASPRYQQWVIDDTRIWKVEPGKLLYYGRYFYNELDPTQGVAALLDKAVRYPRQASIGQALAWTGAGTVMGQPVGVMESVIFLNDGVTVGTSRLPAGASALTNCVKYAHAGMIRNTLNTVQSELGILCPGKGAVLMDHAVIEDNEDNITDPTDLSDADLYDRRSVVSWADGVAAPPFQSALANLVSVTTLSLPSAEVAPLGSGGGAVVPLGTN